MKHHRPHYDNRNKDSQPRKYDVASYEAGYANIKGFRQNDRQEFRGTDPPAAEQQRIGRVDPETGCRYLGSGASEHVRHRTL